MGSGTDEEVKLMELLEESATALGTVANQPDYANKV